MLSIYYPELACEKQGAEISSVFPILIETCYKVLKFNKLHMIICPDILKLSQTGNVVVIITLANISNNSVNAYITNTRANLNSNDTTVCFRAVSGTLST